MTGRRLAAFLLAATFVAAGSVYYFGSKTPVALAKNSLAKPAAHNVSPTSLPMFFEANQGQTDPSVKFLSRGHGYSLFLTPAEAVLRLRRFHGSQKSGVASQPDETPSVIRMRLAGANSAARVSGAELLPGKSNYFIGNNPSQWHRNIPQYGRVNYQAVYPGIDLTYYGNQGQLEYDFRVAPGVDPNQIALTFDGASTRLDGGDLVLSTSHGDVRFHAPTIYQANGATKKAIVGSFRRLADNKIGFQIGNYDRNRELVIDPSLSYFTYLGGSGTETNTQVAVDPSLNIYLAGTTDSADFPVKPPGSVKTGIRNVFIAKLNPSIPLPQSQLVYATYLGGSAADDLTGAAVDAGGQVFVAGITTSIDFPHTAGAFQVAPAGPGTHGFVTKLDANGVPAYSTYLSGTNAAGNTSDLITGIAIDTRGDAFVTGTTNSTDVTTGFPSTPSAFQQTPLAATQFFASKIDTTKTGAASLPYSTYFGGANPAVPSITGGGIAVDNSGNMYITGATDFLFDPNAPPPPAPRTNFPILNAQQSCLDGAPTVTACDLNATAVDAFVAKINPNRVGVAGLVYSTYLGGSKPDSGIGIAVDAAGNAYVTGGTLSDDWVAPTATPPFQTTFAANGSNRDAFVAKIGNPTGTSLLYPLTYFTYIGGTGDDVGQAIAVDAANGAHVTGTTGSPDLQVLNPVADPGAPTDAFVAQILTNLGGRAAGDYLSYLGGNQSDRGLSIAVDSFNTTYVAGETQSTDFPHPGPPAPLPFQPNLNGPQDAFLATISANSFFIEDPAAPPTASPNPATLGSQVTFVFNFINIGPDPASLVTFSTSFPFNGIQFNSATASPGGTCPNANQGVVTCPVGTVAVNGKVSVSIILTPTTGTQSVTLTGISLSFNKGQFQSFPSFGPVPVTDFAISVAPPSVTINAGESTSFVATLSPVPNGGTFAGTITMSPGTLPTATTGTFTSPTVSIPGASPVTTTLNIATTARPVTTGSLFRGGPLYATWLPVGGLSLLGLGVGAGVTRRRWLAGMLLGLVAGLILLQAACGSSGSSTTTTGGTPAGTYTITITGSSGSDSHNQRVTLIVN
ncbi:MAG TPA: SBBP repeat-containing protein [Terriglobales bacterium]|nr:SBBP repeat-containing protein [Terriglobales bacterium]